MRKNLKIWEKLEELKKVIYLQLMRIFNLIFLLFIFNFSLSQNALKPYDCILLTKSIETKIFQEYFYLYKHKNENLTIIDTNKYFKNCSIPNIFNRDIKIENVLNYIIHKKTKTDKINVNIILLYKVSLNKNVYLLYFWQPYSNANLILELTITKEKIKIKTIEYGVF